MPGAGTTPQFRWPATLDSTNKVVRYIDGSGAADATMAEGDHFWRNDATANDLAEVLKDALDTAAVATGSGQTYTVALNDNGTLTITASAGTVQLDWSHANTTADRTLFGFDAGLTSSAISISSDFQVGNAWHPEQAYVDDSERVPVYRSAVTGIMNGRTRTQRWGSVTKRQILVDILPPNKVFTAEEIRQNEAFERFQAWLSQGGRYEFCRDFPNTPGTYQTYVPDPDVPEAIQAWPATIPHGTIRRYNIEFSMQAYQA